DAIPPRPLRRLHDVRLPIRKRRSRSLGHLHQHAALVRRTATGGGTKFLEPFRLFEFLTEFAQFVPDPRADLKVEHNRKGQSPRIWAAGKRANTDAGRQSSN